MFSRQVNTGQAARAAGGGERVRSELVIFPLQFGRKEPDMAVPVLIERGWAEPVRRVYLREGNLLMLPLMLTLLHNDPLLQHDANLLMRHHIGCHPPVRRLAKGIGQTRRPFRRLCDLFCLCSVRNLLLH